MKIERELLYRYKIDYGEPKHKLIEYWPGLSQWYNCIGFDIFDNISRRMPFEMPCENMERESAIHAIAIKNGYIERGTNTSGLLMLMIPKEKHEN